ncbi:hypothetical protein NKH70_30435 [Mesorhizobium sp. M0991]|uniref:hypothetical protein n=1 Tax=Mesorhizobium sp. M0991 TaxID=2957043 RepID=UPI0033399F2D
MLCGVVYGRKLIGSCAADSQERTGFPIKNAPMGKRFATIAALMRSEISAPLSYITAPMVSSKNVPALPWCRSDPEVVGNGHFGFDVLDRFDQVVD